jgi:hypothetical protein
MAPLKVDLGELPKQKRPRSIERSRYPQGYSGDE